MIVAEAVHRWNEDGFVILQGHAPNTALTLASGDTLIEKAASSANLYGLRQPFFPSQFYAVPMAPIASRRGVTFGTQPIDTFRLFKLHGSINWYYSGSDRFFGETIYEVGMGLRWGEIDTEAEIGRSVIDKVPLIIPPTLSKSRYFENETVRAQWRMTRRALIRNFEGIDADSGRYVGLSDRCVATEDLWDRDQRRNPGGWQYFKNARWEDRLPRRSPMARSIPPTSLGSS